MAVRFFTSTPQGLLNNFNARIEQDDTKGKITTWIRSADKKYYTHASSNWSKKAWFKPSIYEGKLLFNIIKPNNSNINRVTYGYYHGHLIETFLNHFDSDFSTGVATAMPTNEDVVK